MYNEQYRHMAQRNATFEFDRQQILSKVDGKENVDTKLLELSGMDDDPHAHLSRVFESDSKGVVLERDIPFYSLCEHHILPFFGTVHIAYIPDGKVTGISKLARTYDGSDCRCDNGRR